MKTSSTIVTLLMIVNCVFGGEDLKTEYYEAAVNSFSDTTINYKKWTTSRENEVILVREEHDLSRDGSWSQIDQTIMSNGKASVRFVSFLAKRSWIYYPDSGVKVMRSDSDGDGFLERITLFDGDDKVIDIFTVDKAGKITPITDEELAKLQKSMKELSETMRDFDRAKSK